MRGLRALIIYKVVSPESMEKVVKLLRIDPHLDDGPHIFSHTPSRLSR